MSITISNRDSKRELLLAKIRHTQELDTHLIVNHSGLLEEIKDYLETEEGICTVRRAYEPGFSVVPAECVKAIVKKPEKSHRLFKK